jgi:hypothetical protein
MRREYYVNNKDLAFSDDGDLVVEKITTETGEVKTTLLTVRGKDELLQNISNRIKTNLMELFLHEDYGNRLMKMVGKRNTRENAERGRQFLIDTILRNNEVLIEDHLEVIATTTGPEEILYIIRIQTTPFSTVDMVIELNLLEGVRRII